MLLPRVESFFNLQQFGYSQIPVVELPNLKTAGMTWANVPTGITTALPRLTVLLQGVSPHIKYLLHRGGHGGFGFARGTQ